MFLHNNDNVIGVMKLPVEVLEEIFSYVDDHDVINAAYASLQWNTVCQRIARHRCATKIPQVRQRDADDAPVAEMQEICLFPGHLD